MLLLKNNFFKRIIVSLSIVILLVFFCMSPISNASKIKMEDGEFYYSGTTKGAYVVSEGVFSWLLSKIGDIADFLLGIMTMGGRMVFVGWTALFEKLLTWALEATTGVEMDITEINATSVEDTTNSSDNVTVEAIIYNQVPIFDINFFREQTVNRCVSGTGRFTVECEECAKENDKNDKSGLCRMRKCDCENCKKILDEKYNNNVISVVRENVIEWYYVIRYTAIIAMLCLLIVIGIKMAITSAASEKAVYKKMLVDWLVGMILLFSIHYIMVVIVNFNEVMVDIIKEAQTGVEEVTKKELHYNETKTDDDLEISIYEAVRTRAYDPKLINGTTGMIMYITLVFFAVRFSFVYFKRYLTMIALTLMAPGVGLAYAFQKVMSGKSKSFSKWLHEYFVNAIIQTIHALIYTSFVTTALVISLNSVSGMIFALVLMNFMLKADKIFRKVFKLSEGGSLAESTLEKSDPKQLMKNAKSAATFMAGGKLMQKTPISKAIKAPLRMAKTGLVDAAININEKYNEKHELSDEEKINKQINKSENLYKIADEASKQRRKLGTNATKEYTDAMNDFDNEADIIGLDRENAIETELDSLEQEAYARMTNEELSEDERKEAQEIYKNVQNLKVKFDNETNITTGEVFRAHLNKILDRNNYYDYDATKPEGKQYTRGKKVYDPVKNKMVKRKMADLISEQITLKNMLGMTKEDEKLFKETTDLMKGTLLGMGSMFVGLGTVVSNPLVGMGLLANGVASRHKYLEARGYYDNTSDDIRVISDKNKRYSFNRFGKGSKQTITRVIRAQAEGEKDRVVVENVKRKHTKLYKALKLDGMGIKVAGTVGAVGLMTGAAPVVSTSAVALGVASSLSKRADKYSMHSQNALIGRIEKNHFKQYKSLRKKLNEDEIKILSTDEKKEYKDNYKKLIDLVFATNEAEKKNEEINKLQQELNEEAGNIVKTKDGQKIELPTLTNTVKTEGAIIEQATAEVLVSKATEGNLDETIINSEKTLGEIKKSIELKLKAQGILQDGGELDKNINDKIKKSADKLIKEINGEKPTDENGNETLGLLDNELIRQSLTEQVQLSELKDIGKIDSESIKDLVEEKKRVIMSKQSTNNVTEEIQNLKKLIQNREAILPGMDIEKTFKMREQLENWKNELAQAQERKGVTFEEKSQVSKETKNAIQNAIIQINQPVAVVSDPKRNKKQAKHQENTEDMLKSLLESVATGEETTNVSGETKSVDEVIQQLFKTTEQQSTAYELVGNVTRMRNLNKRGNNAKMKSKNNRVYDEKKENKEENLETYGPVTNIVDLIKKTNGTSKRNEH